MGETNRKCQEQYEKPGRGGNHETKHNYDNHKEEWLN